MDVMHKCVGKSFFLKNLIYVTCRRVHVPRDQYKVFAASGSGGLGQIYRSMGWLNSASQAIKMVPSERWHSGEFIGTTPRSHFLQGTEMTAFFLNIKCLLPG